MSDGLAFALVFVFSFTYTALDITRRVGRRMDRRRNR